ncbi:MAG: alpha/beta fold hydrolase [Planctomycetota bacterium]
MSCLRVTHVTLLVIAGLLCLSGCAHTRFHAFEPLLPEPETCDAPQWLVGFRYPSFTGSQTELVAVEGYQAGKIPVVFVHGLASDATAWDEMIAELMKDSSLRQQFQFWTFRYPTGASYLHSAAELRIAWIDALTRYDPQGRDEALRNAVFVGHSMGGLLSRLQVTTCDDQLWRCVPKEAMTEVLRQPTLHAALKRAFEFKSQPTIRRVVYIATPHGGSHATESIPGKIASRLVVFPEEIQKSFETLRSGTEGLPDRVPNAVDHLAPGNAVLETVASLPIALNVKTHSIIGSGFLTPGPGTGDRVVTVANARTPGVESELLVESKHTDIHRARETVAELKRILRVHADEAIRQ